MTSNYELLRSVTIYGGFVIFILGTFGNLLIIGFLWRIRKNSCVFLILVSSFFNCAALFNGLLTRILTVGFNVDWSTTHPIWCKTRIAATQTSFLISLTCTCLASIDRLLNSCRQNKYRQMSNLSTSLWALVIAIAMWLIHTIPYIMHANLFNNTSTNTVICSLDNNPIISVYQKYVALPLHLGLLPAGILITTGLMTYKNTNKLQIQRQRQLFQKQLTSMMLLEIPIILCSIIPYVIYSEYDIFTASITKPQYQKDIENLFMNIFRLTFYIAFACPFFVLFISSKTFRSRVIRFFLCQRTTELTTNRIQPGITIATISLAHRRINQI